MAGKTASKMVKASGKTYFFDVQQTKEGKSYLKITESRIKGENRMRSSINIFPEHLKDFKNALTEISEEVETEEE